MHALSQYGGENLVCSDTKVQSLESERGPSQTQMLLNCERLALSLKQFSMSVHVNPLIGSEPTIHRNTQGPESESGLSPNSMLSPT